MIKLLTGVVAVFVCLLSMTSAIAADKPSQISVAYFKGWPTPNQFAQIKNAYDLALGIEVNWIPFQSGIEMNAAMASGQVQIAYSHGHVPFVVAVTGGLDLTMVGIAVAYPDNDNCIVRSDAGISRANASQLEGMKVATPIGNPTHYRLLKVLAHLGVDASKVELVPTNDGAAAKAALQSGEVVMACAYGSHLRAMSELGSPLLSGAEQEKIGLKIFDIVSVPTQFLNQQPEIVQGFMDVTEASNAQWKLNPEPMRAAIARAAEMNLRVANQTLSEFQFPSAIEQRTEAWMSGLVLDYTRDIAAFFVEQGQLEESFDSYDDFITRARSIYC